MWRLDGRDGLLEDLQRSTVMRWQGAVLGLDRPVEARQKAGGSAE
jgi:hypothetical protein